MQPSVVLSQISNYTQLWNFLECFQYKLITLSVQPEKGLPPAPLDNKGFSIFSAKNRVRSFTLAELKNDKTIEELQLIQSLGYGIYFMVNEGDGVPKDLEDGNLNCGRRSNVKKLKALFIDQDKANFEALKQKLIQINLMPHFVVQSSTDKHHLYFLIEEEESNPQNILYWESLQRFLDDLVPDLDQSMGDINQILRLPLFHNLKPEYKIKQKVSIRLWPDFRKVPLYNLKSLFDRFELHTNHSVDKLYVNGDGISFKERFNAFRFPLGFLKEGERRTEITRYIEHLMENLLPLEAKAEDYFILVDGFINKYLHPKDRQEFLPGGIRRKNIEQYLEDQREYRLRKRAESDSQDAIEAIKRAEKVQAGKLEDRFYLNFPGETGLLVREIAAYDAQIPKEMIFATALSVLGLLKCERFRLFDAWPLINGLIIAQPGAGKSTLKNITEEIVNTAGLRGKFPRILQFQKSVQSLHHDLYRAGGAGLTLVDEAGGYLKALSSPQAAQYISELKDYYKNATTGSDKGNTLSPGKSMSFKMPPIYGGMLSLWMLIQPEKFTDVMSYSDMADGFLPRFFVFEGHIGEFKFADATKGRPTFRCSPELMAVVVGYGGLLNEEQIQIEVKEELEEFKKQNPKAKRDEISMHEIELVHERRKMFRQRDENRINVEILPDALEVMEKYLRGIEVIANKLESDDSKNFIYKRVQEMLLRLLCCTCHFDFEKGRAFVDLRLMEACIEFQQFQFERFFETQMVEIMKAQPEVEEDMVLKAIRKYMMKYEELPTRGDILAMIRHNKRPKSLSDVLRRLLYNGDIEEVKRDHRNIKGKPVMTYKICAAEV